MKVFQTAAIVVTGLALTGLAVRSLAGASADPQLLGLLMPDAKVIAGAQLNEAKASPFGQFVLSQAGPVAELDKLKAETGFDPRTDLTEIVAGIVGPGGGLVAGHGSFQPTRITNLAMTAGAVVESYRGINLIGGGSKPDDPTVAFLDGTTVVIGPNPFVKAAVDRWIGGRVTGALTAKATEASAASQAWVVAAALSELQPKSDPNTPAAPEAQMVQNVLSKITGVSGGLNFGDTITMTGQAQTPSAQDAQALTDVFHFVMALGASKAPLPALPQVTASGSNVNFTLTLTEQQVEQLLRPAVTLRAAVRN